MATWSQHGLHGGTKDMNSSFVAMSALKSSGKSPKKKKKDACDWIAV